MPQHLKAKEKIKIGTNIIERRVYAARIGNVKFFYTRYKRILYLAEPDGDYFMATRRLTPAEVRAVNPYIIY